MQREIRINKLLEMKTLMPSDPFPTYALGLEYHEMGDSHKSDSLFEETMFKFPDYLPVYYQLGLLLAEKWRNSARQKPYLKPELQLHEQQKDLKTMGIARSPF